MVQTTLDLIRHGEPVGGRKYRGQLDEPLSEKGWQQMRDAVAHACPWQAIISSTLSRCAEFARELADRHALPLHLDARFTEIGFGSWEGKTASELLAGDPGILQHFWSDPVHNTPPGAEAVSDFRVRILAAWQEVLKQFAGQHVLIVGHAGMMRMIIRETLGMPLEKMFYLQVDNAGISRIRVDGKGGDALSRLLFHNAALPEIACSPC